MIKSPKELVIVDSSTEKDDSGNTIAYFWTASGECVEIPIEHQDGNIRQSGKLAARRLCECCDVLEFHDFADFRGKPIRHSDWDEIVSILKWPHCSVMIQASSQASSSKGRYVYVISCQDGAAPLCKIGIASSPEKRLSQLSTGSPHALRLELAIYSSNARAVELAAHLHFSDIRQNGEWFAITAFAAIDYIVSVTRETQ